MDSYEFELFEFWDDLEYADDAYWDYGLSNKEDNLKRKREEVGRKDIVDKRQKTEINYSREDDPLLFVSREERTRAFFQPAPLLENPVNYTFLADWRKRFANEDGGIGESKEMPVNMKRAAEAETTETADGMEDDEEGDWEDEGEDDQDDEGEEGEEGPGLDPDMLKEILKQKLGDAGLGGEDEAAFMQVIAKMMSGDDDADEFTGNLANSLLGKVTSDSGGDSALSGWLSQQGVSLQDGDDDDASSVATVDLPEGLRHTGLNTRQNAQDSPIDSVVGEKKPTSQNSLHAGSLSSSSTKKRMATAMEGNEKPSKKQKKVTFDVPPSSSSEDLSTQNTASDGAADIPTSEDPLMSESNLQQRPTRSGSKDTGKTTGVEEKTKPRTTRKRKAVDADADADADMEGSVEKPPEKKKSRKKELDMLENPAAGSPMGPPARRTRSARAKSGK